MSILEAILLGAIEGLTEFLPVSSTGHLTIAEEAARLRDRRRRHHRLHRDHPGRGSGGRGDLLLGRPGDRHLARRRDRRPGKRSTRDFRFGLAVAVGSLPIAVAGLVFKDAIERPLRSLWVVGAALILWSLVMYVADRSATQRRTEEEFGMRDALPWDRSVRRPGPGVSRSGATIAAGLFRGLDRVTVTRMSFFLAIPALTAAGLLEAVTAARNRRRVGWGPTLVALLVSFLVAYASIAWLLRYVARHNFNLFVAYRIVLGFTIVGLVAPAWPTPPEPNLCAVPGISPGRGRPVGARPRVVGAHEPVFVAGETGEPQRVVHPRRSSPSQRSQTPPPLDQGRIEAPRSAPGV